MAKLTGQPQRNPLVKNRIRMNNGSGDTAAIPAVRILPMDPKEEFKDWSIEDVQDDFFLEKLVAPKRPPGKYNYHKLGLRTPKGAIVLFQYEGMIIASAIFFRSKPFEKPEGDYLGALYFEPDSIEVFDPIGAIAIKKVWPIVTRLGRAKWKLDPNSYPAFKQLRRHIRKAPSQ